MKRRNDPEWRDIPGYNGMYQISRMGEVRSWQKRWRGDKPVTEPRLLTQYIKATGKRTRTRFVRLTDGAGKAREESVLRLMVDVWLGGGRPGMVPYHKNGDLADNCAHNIAFATRQQLGRMTGAKANRKPVVKIAPNGEVVDAYPSARAAARANHMSYQTVLDRCNGRVKNPFALDGHNYQYER